MMNRRGLRRKCTRLIEGLNLSVPFSLEDLCRQTSERRRRRIRLAPLAFPASGPAGLLVSTASVDYVFYEAHTTPTHQNHVAVHELGHLLLGHSGTDPAGDGAEVPGGTLLPDDIDPALIRHMLGRTHYSRPDEYAAEYFATQVLRLVSGAPLDTAAVPPDMRDLVGRLERSLRHTTGPLR
ncbi:ParH-like protein [Streptomyces sp. NPDC001606]